MRINNKYKMYKYKTSPDYRLCQIGFVRTNPKTTRRSRVGRPTDLITSEPVPAGTDNGWTFTKTHFLATSGYQGRARKRSECSAERLGSDGRSRREGRGHAEKFTEWKSTRAQAVRKHRPAHFRDPFCHPA